MSTFDKLNLFFFVGFSLVFVGIIVILTAVLLSGCDSASFGAAIFIGPSPIVFGTGLDPELMVPVSLFLAGLSVAFFWVLKRRISSSSG